MSADGADGWGGVASLGPGWFRYAGVLGTAETHAHHTVQVIVARRGEVVLADASGARLGCRACVIPADVPHAVVRGVDEMVLTHLDPETPEGRELGRSVDPPHSVGAWSRAGDVLRARTAAPQVEPRFPRHPAVATVLRLLPERLDGPPVRLSEMARAVNLSESRLAHLFSEEVGLPFRPYVLWLRMRRAMEMVAAGRSLTEAAHEAGFADSAHLSRVSRRMFGIAPSQFTRGVEWVADGP